MDVPFTHPVFELLGKLSNGGFCTILKNMCGLVERGELGKCWAVFHLSLNPVPCGTSWVKQRMLAKFSTMKMGSMIGVRFFAGDATD